MVIPERMVLAGMKNNKGFRRFFEGLFFIRVYLRDIF